jgi:hypothetical protein
LYERRVEWRSVIGRTLKEIEDELGHANVVRIDRGAKRDE